MRRQLDSGGWKHLQHLVEITGLQFLELCVWVQQQQCNGLVLMRQKPPASQAGQIDPAALAPGFLDLCEQHRSFFDSA